MIKSLRVIPSSVLIATLVFGCDSSKEIELYEMKTIFRSSVESSRLLRNKLKVEICDTIPFSWDSVIVIPAFTPSEQISKLEIINSDDLNGVLTNFLSDEGNRILAFIEDSRVIRISVIPSKFVDLNTLVKPGNYIAILPKEEFCERLYFHNVNDTTVIASVQP